MFKATFLILILFTNNLNLPKSSLMPITFDWYVNLMIHALYLATIYCCCWV